MLVLIVSRMFFKKGKRRGGKWGRLSEETCSIRFSAFKNPETGGIWT